MDPLSLHPNNLRAFGALPAELIVQIFSNLDLESLMYATWTCSRWRKVALDSSDIWRNLEFFRVMGGGWEDHALHAILKRSRARTTSIALYDLTRNDDGELELIPEPILYNLHRTRELTLHFTPRGLDACDMVVPAPLLERLVLSTKCIRYRLQRLPCMFLGGEAPRLVSLTLRGFALPRRGEYRYESVLELIFVNAPDMDGDGVGQYDIQEIADTFPNLRRMVTGSTQRKQFGDIPKREGLMEVVCYPPVWPILDALCLDSIPRVELHPLPGDWKLGEGEDPQRTLVEPLAGQLGQFTGGVISRTAFELGTSDGHVLAIQLDSDDCSKFFTGTENDPDDCAMMRQARRLSSLRIDAGVLAQLADPGDGCDDLLTYK
jgi:hypothetical protein